MSETEQHNLDRSRNDPVMTIPRNRGALQPWRIVGEPDSKASVGGGRA